MNKVEKVGSLVVVIIIVTGGIAGSLLICQDALCLLPKTTYAPVGICTKDNVVIMVFPANTTNPHIRVVEIFDNGTITHFIDPSPPINCPMIRFGGS